MKEDNILIAKFMGWKIDNSFPDKDRIYKSPGGAIELDTTLKFHKDWNLLMDIVETIEHKYHHPFFTFKSDVTIKDNSTISSPTIVNVMGILDKKKAYHKAIVEFVKWYNVREKDSQG